ncbi:hypothetical protein MTO96_024023 [Rhipicephalus appendiculatus]
MAPVLDMRCCGYQSTSTSEAGCVFTVTVGGCCNGASSGASRSSTPVVHVTSSWSCEVVDVVNVDSAEGRCGIRSSHKRLIATSGEWTFVITRSPRLEPCRRLVRYMDKTSRTRDPTASVPVAGSRRPGAPRSWVPADVELCRWVSVGSRIVVKG